MKSIIRYGSSEITSVFILGASDILVSKANELTSCFDHKIVISTLNHEHDCLFASLSSDCKWLAFLPQGTEFKAVSIDHITTRNDAIIPWPSRRNLPEKSCSEPLDMEGWIISALLAESISQFDNEEQLSLSAIKQQFDTSKKQLSWFSLSLATDYIDVNRGESEPVLHRDSRIVALIPHYRCEQWLSEALNSLLRQTRPLDGIVVIDDASERAPLEICRLWPEVSLYQSQQRVGPYRLVQTIMESSPFDGYLFQDADDWSAVDRLELLLYSAENSGAELIGSQEIRIPDGGSFQEATYPLNINVASESYMTHPLLHPTSLLSRQLHRRLYGFATGLRYGGDTEFLYRAIFDGRIRNIPDFSYFHRIRPGSLTTAVDTGMQSEPRQTLLTELRRRGNRNIDRVKQGQQPNLKPMCLAVKPGLTHLAGPEIRTD